MNLNINNQSYQNVNNNNKMQHKKLPQLSAQKQKLRNKKQTEISFQKNYQDNSMFDHIIQSQYQKMLRQKQQTPSLFIPKNFEKFIKSKSFKQLLKKVYQYCAYLSQIQTKYKKLDNQIVQRKGDNCSLNFYNAQLNKLNEKCKQISFVYSGIILSQGDCKYMFRDQYFFQTMLYFLNQIMKQAFDKQQYFQIEEQINRIFRTNTFNLIRRRHQQDQLLKKYPLLKQTKNQSIPNILNKIIQRNLMFKSNKKSESKQKIQIKPFNIKSSPFKSVRSRSPVMSLIFPSQKQKLFIFNKQVRKRGQYIKSNRYSQIDFQKSILKHQQK